MSKITTAQIDNYEYIDDINVMISEMTLEEKVGQMTQLTLDVISKGGNRFYSAEPYELDDSLARIAVVDYKVGSVLNVANNRARTPKVWFETISTLQKMATEETRMKIPVIYGIDAIHGTTYSAKATMFPQQIGMAATWNTDLVTEGSKVTAYETRASSIPWNFSPVLDMGRNPYWPRIWETFGESQKLTVEMGLATIKGYEGDNKNRIGNQNVASCLKHFLAYGTPTTGKDRTPVVLSERELREIHLPSFKAAIEAGALSLMVNSGLINGVPVHSDKTILTDLLKDEMKFEGVVVTDWADIENLHTRDKVASSHKEAIKMAINAGIDMSMVPYHYERYCKLLVELVNEGEVYMERIDDAVRRILIMKKKLGLFESPTTDYRKYPDFASKKHQMIAQKAAEESITLLDNEELLPLSKEAKILLTGPNANSMRTLNGGWTYSWQGEKVEEFSGGFNTIKEAIENKIGSENVVYVPGLEYKMDGKYYEEQNIDIESAVRAAAEVDVIVICIGENTYTEKPGDMHELDISVNQRALALALYETGKPVVLVLNEGRPRIIREINDQARAVLHMYLPGNHGGDALANILFGDVNPSGRLPYTYPMFSNTPITYDHKPSENQDKMEGVYDYESEFAIQYPFGHGLSYTTFEYANLSLSSPSFTEGGSITVSVDVKNSGDLNGKEAVLMYTSDLFASVTPNNKQLAGFDKISLKRGETKKVQFEIKAEDLQFIGRDMKWVTEPGEFKVSIGGLEQTFEYKKKEEKAMKCSKS